MSENENIFLPTIPVYLCQPILIDTSHALHTNQITLLH